MGSLLKNIDRDRNVYSFINSNVKLKAPAPTGGIGGLMRDFRIDEDHGMPYDPRFAPTGP